MHNLQNLDDLKGLVSMANRGRNTNSSQFIITLKACPHFDDKYVVFGQVVEGLDFVRAMSRVPCDRFERPKIPIAIVDCGDLNDKRSFLKNDPFQKSIWESIYSNTPKQLGTGSALPTGDVGEIEEKEEASGTKGKSKLEVKAEGKEAREDDDQSQEEEGARETSIQGQPQLNERQMKRLQELRMKSNEARTFNRMAVAEEEKVNTDHDYVKYLKKEEWLQRNSKNNDVFLFDCHHPN